METALIILLAILSISNAIQLWEIRKLKKQYATFLIELMEENQKLK